MSGVGIEGHAALVVDDNESRTIDSNVARVSGPRQFRPRPLTSAVDVFV
jgi:hypothetical protein